MRYRKYLVTICIHLILVCGASVITSCVGKIAHPTSTSQSIPSPLIESNSAPKEESPEAKAVRIAEEFITHNGYTDLPPDKNHISSETVEEGDTFNQLLDLRHDTLERKAYGICYRGRLEMKRGWSVVFRRKYRNGEVDNKWGRCVTMDNNFENVLVEHKGFPLVNVDKKLPLSANK